MSFLRSILFALLFVAFAGEAIALEGWLVPSDSLNSRRRNGVYIGYTAGVSVFFASMYCQNPGEYGFSNFGVFNDNKYWLQMDKFRHVSVAYHLGEFGMGMLMWAGVDERNASWQGGLLSLFFLSGQELLKGFKGNFSWGDQLANTAGAGLLIGQGLIWGEQRFRVKSSYFPSGFAKYNPEQLGNNLIASSRSDYSGKTQWLSFSPGSFMENGRFPSWLCLSVGYSANGIIGGLSNPRFGPDGELLPEYERYRQFFLSLDVDLTRLEPRSEVLRALFSVFGFIKIPFPALEYNSLDGVRLRPFYF